MEGRKIKELLENVQDDKLGEKITASSENPDEELYKMLEDNTVSLHLKKEFLDNFDVHKFVLNLTPKDIFRLLQINNTCNNIKLSEFCWKVFETFELKEGQNLLYEHLKDNDFFPNKNF